MRRAAHIEGETTWVPLRALRIGLPEETDENERWNSRTLASMARAGFIELVGSRREEAATFIGVRVRRSDLGADAAWHEFEAMRRRVRDASAAQPGACRPPCARRQGVRGDSYLSTPSRTPAPDCGSCRPRHMRRVRVLFPAPAGAGGAAAGRPTRGGPGRSCGARQVCCAKSTV